MITGSPALQDILRALGQLAQRLKTADVPAQRAEILRDMRVLLDDADKIVETPVVDASLPSGTLNS